MLKWPNGTSKMKTASESMYPTDHSVKLKESEKKDTYLHLARELK